MDGVPMRPSHDELIQFAEFVREFGGGHSPIITLFMNGWWLNLRTEAKSDEDALFDLMKTAYEADMPDWYRNAVADWMMVVDIDGDRMQELPVEDAAEHTQPEDGTQRVSLHNCRKIHVS